MAKFWYEHPIIELEQRYGMYPNARLYWLGTYNPEHQKLLNEKFYTRESLEEIRKWCEINCKGIMVFSEKYGSFTFDLERDRTLMRLFFPMTHFVSLQSRTLP
jgi:hypothetical protein